MLDVREVQEDTYEIDLRWAVLTVKTEEEYAHLLRVEDGEQIRIEGRRISRDQVLYEGEEP